MLELDSRKQEILKTVIDTYIHAAEPVGSESVAHRIRLGISPATIRNEMAVLEEIGYLSHPHTSAGRVPTDRGYRFYVDSMLEEEQLTPQERYRIRRRFVNLTEEIGRVPEEAARTLASVTNYASVVAEPRPDRRVFKHLHFIPLSSTQVMAVIVTNTGALEGMMLDLVEPLALQELDRLSRMVSQRLEGCTLVEITDEMLAKVVDEAAWQQRILHQLAQWLRHNFPAGADRRVYIEGTANILKQPEFQDARAARPVLTALEREEVVADLLEHTPNRQVWVTIGREHRYEDLRGCSVVAAVYQVGGHDAGALGIVGPTRMKYSKVISLVRYLADSLTGLLRQSS